MSMSYNESFSRAALLYGNDGLEKLKNARVAVFGVGGVGGYVVEALARSGVGTFHLIDNDTVSPSNLNRQIIALHSTIGRPKVEVMKERILDINPEAEVHIYPVFVLADTLAQPPFDLLFQNLDYVIDAVDTVTAKLAIIMASQAAGVPVISSMGTGNKLDPSHLKIADIYKTSVCPLAKVMRHELKARGVRHLTVLYSDELPAPYRETPENKGNTGSAARPVPGSTSFVPPSAGLMIAGKVVRDLAGM